jgi:hypothetical protein
MIERCPLSHGKEHQQWKIEQRQVVNKHHPNNKRRRGNLAPHPMSKLEVNLALVGMPEKLHVRVGRRGNLATPHPMSKLEVTLALVGMPEKLPVRVGDISLREERKSDG